MKKYTSPYLFYCVLISPIGTSDDFVFINNNTFHGIPYNFQIEIENLDIESNYFSNLTDFYSETQNILF